MNPRLPPDDPAPPPRTTRARLAVGGIVQGVGFRPFIHRLAHEHGLRGWVLNSTEGVVLEVEGSPEAVDRFVADIPAKAPPRASVERVERADLPPIGYTSFSIETSQEVQGGFALVSPDICICEDCLREMRDPSDRRHRYPFINCTNCGPRFTIVEDVPYDRPKTTMGCFPMCPECEAEYHDPTDRRFHAQPNACPVCGPKVWMVESRQLSAIGHQPEGGGDAGESDRRETKTSPASNARAIASAAGLLAEGRILAVKGLGGFHLACDATNGEAVAELRLRKRRSDKPFAVMSPNAGTVATYCYLDDSERRLLESPQRPIVLLRRREDSPISPLVAPSNRYLGVMLPYTPLHHLLLDELSAASRSVAAGSSPRVHDRNIGKAKPVALVMTSGNLSEEPIATGNREALERLASLADGFLLHDRDIRVRCDDSVTRLFRGQESVIRRSRGYAPFPVRLSFELRDLLACGAELKSTFCITRGSYAFLSQHIGDLENAETLESFADSVEHFRRLFHLKVAAIAHDLHPEYLSTRYAWDKAEEWGGLPLVPVQHHHAHIASCMAENGVDETVIGVAFDGTGYGDDGRLWGGEFLVCDYAGYRRAAHFGYVPLPGGEAAIKRPYRMATSYLLDAFGPGILGRELPPFRGQDPAELRLIQRQIERGINAPPTSSVGRLFDAVSAIAGIRQVVNYEGQAAIEMEMSSRGEVEDRYEWNLRPGEPPVIDTAPTIRRVVEEVERGVAPGVIATRFHNTVADIIASLCESLRRETGIGTVALSGGVFQNLFLLERACRLLEKRGFRVLTHHQVPPNDGCIALGQAAIANRVHSKNL